MDNAAAGPIFDASYLHVISVLPCQRQPIGAIHEVKIDLTLEAPFELRERFESPRSHDHREIAPSFFGKLSATEIDVQDTRYRAHLTLVEGLRRR
ncbi:MAG: hypothetical protein IPM54_17570 [Polyangiaceae bacterium]|nr:hypothetical protein [Polyangiaceae bacterium]